jgi:hypothetical protein
VQKSKIVLNGRILLRRPRLHQSCSAIEEEEVPYGNFNLVTPATLGSRILVMNKYIHIILKPRE